MAEIPSLRLSDGPAPIADVSLSGAGRGRIFRRRADPEILCEISDSVIGALDALDRVVSSGRSEVLLIWPQRPDSVAVYHALASIRRLEDCDHGGLTTLFFPWTRNTSAMQRALLVDRDFIYKATLPALNRVMKDAEREPAVGYLMALHSLRHMLSGKKLPKRHTDALKKDPGLVHPNLLEMLPQSGITDDGLQAYKGQFLRRVGRHTWIADCTERMDSAIDPAKTPFFLYGVHGAAPSDVLRSAMPRGKDGKGPDLLLLDVTRRARQSLGRWKEAVSHFLEIARSIYGESTPPVLAVSDDAFVLQTLRWTVIKEYEDRRGQKRDGRGPAKASVVLSHSPDPLDEVTVTATEVPAIIVESYGTDILRVVDEGLSLRRSLNDAGQHEIADAVTTAVSVAQALVGLPGTPAQLFDFLIAEYDGHDLQILGGQYDHQAPLAKMKVALDKGLAGAHHEALSRFKEGYQGLCDATQQDTPGRKLFDEWLRSLTDSNSRMMVLCSSELLRGFVVWRIENSPELMKVRSLIGDKVVVVDRREAMESIRSTAGGEEGIERILFVEPRTDDLLHVLTMRGLPREILVLSNLANIEQALRRVRILASLSGIEPVKSTLLAVQSEFESQLAGRSSDIPDLEAELQVPRLGTLDLTVGVAAGSGARRLIETSSGMRIKAFDGSEVAVYDPDALQPFRRKLAKDLAPGDEVCVFSPEFVAAAREKLSLTAEAPEVLALYHQAVADAVNSLPGTDTSSKVKALRKRMRENDPSLDLPGEQAMRHWIEVGPLLQMPRDKVRPQAPRDRQHFLSFMKALGLSEDVARHYWDFGIFWTRSRRIRKGAEFHQVFMSILIDPYGVVSRLPRSRHQEVWKIHATAEQHIVSVTSNKEEGFP